MSKKLISICVPVLNEQDNIYLLYQRVKQTFDALDDYDFEIIFTDNASTDNTYSKIENIAAVDSRIRAASFSRNHGYQQSILSGYLLARGDAAVQLDCDLEDPPEIIVEFLKKWREGYEVVYGVRRKREESYLLTVIRKFYYRILDFISEEHLPKDVGDFRLIDRRIIEVLRQIDDQNPYLRGTIARMGFRQIGIKYDRQPRVAGETKFNFRQLTSLSVDAVVSNSTLPLKLASYLGIVTGLGAVFFSLRFLWGWVAYGEQWPSGFATLAILILVNIAVTSTLFGIFGAYMIRLSAQVKPMPVSIIARSIRLGDITKPTKAIIIDVTRKNNE